MIKKILHFIHYHNFFSIAVILISIWVSTAIAANQNLQQNIIAQKEVVRSVDNTYVVNTDFSAYDVGLKVQNVKEDEDWYYVDYTYNTAEVVDYVWKQVPKTGSMKISKGELGGRDLGLYVANQLGQIGDQQLAYLKNVQKEEKKIGVTQKVVATEYSGLVGQFLSTDEKTFDGYQPVKPPVEVTSDETVSANPTVVGTTLGTTVGEPAPVLTREEVQSLIQDTVKRLLAGESVSTQPTPSEPTTPTDTPTTTDTTTNTSTTTTDTTTSSTTPDTTPTSEPTPTPTPEPTPGTSTSTTP